MAITVVDPVEAQKTWAAFEAITRSLPKDEA
jgi:hypothetical protein